MFITHARLLQAVEAIVHKDPLVLIKCTVRTSDRQCGAEMIHSFFWQRVWLNNLTTVQFHPVIYLTRSYKPS